MVKEDQGIYIYKWIELDGAWEKMIVWMERIRKVKGCLSIKFCSLYRGQESERIERDETYLSIRHTWFVIDRKEVNLRCAYCKF